MRMVSGLWQNRQLNGQPWKKIEVRLPGPSTLEKGMILLTGALSMLLDTAVQGMSAVLRAHAEDRDIVE